MTPDTEYHSVVRRTERPTDADRESHSAYIEELKEAIRLDGIRIRAELAAHWPQTNNEPTV